MKRISLKFTIAAVAMLVSTVVPGAALGADVHKADDDSFKEQVLDRDKPVVVLFVSDNLSSKAARRNLESTARHLNEDVRFVVVDIDEAAYAPTTAHIMSVPTFVLFYRGRVKSALVGASSHHRLEEWIVAWSSHLVDQAPAEEGPGQHDQDGGKGETNDSAKPS